MARDAGTVGADVPDLATTDYDSDVDEYWSLLHMPSTAGSSAPPRLPASRQAPCQLDRSSSVLPAQGAHLQDFNISAAAHQQLARPRPHAPPPPRSLLCCIGTGVPPFDGAVVRFVVMRGVTTQYFSPALHMSAGIRWETTSWIPTSQKKTARTHDPGLRITPGSDPDPSMIPGLARPLLVVVGKDPTLPEGRQRRPWSGSAVLVHTAAKMRTSQ